MEHSRDNQRGGQTQEPETRKHDKQIDSMFHNYLMYSTPLFKHGDDDVKQNADKTTLSNDSGFSDHTFNSTLTLSIQGTPGLSVISPSPNLEAEHERRLTLTECECSPINRESSSRILGRRLSFSAFEPQPPLCQLPFPEYKVQGQHVSSLQSATPSVTNITKEGREKFRPAQEIECHPLVSQQSSADCTSPSRMANDLETGLQEMSLEESMSSALNYRLLPIEMKSAENLSEPDVDIDKCVQNDNHEGEETHSVFYKEIPSDTLGYQPLLNEECRWRENEKQMFLNKLSLTPKLAPEQHKVLPLKFLLTSETTEPSYSHVHHAYLTKTTNKVAAQPHSVTIFTTDLPSTDANHFSESRVPPLPSEYTSSSESLSSPQHFHHLKNVPQLVQHRTSMIHTANSFQHSSALDSLTLRSPSKRLNDCNLVFSPTKARRTHSFQSYNEADTKAATVKRPSKNASKNILTGGVKDFSTSNKEQELQSLWLSKSSNESSTSAKNKPIHEHSGLQDVLHEDDRTRSYLQMVIEKCSPSVPSRLIGRNVGLKKFDILQRLHQQNFGLCVAKILQHLSDLDLISITKVSSKWKSALYSDSHAFSRYRQHLTTHSQFDMQFRDGKENCCEKSVDPPCHPSLTTSRGHLTSLQAQAKEIQEGHPPPPSAQPKDVLLSGDHLRHCPHCQGPALVKPHQDRATCWDEKCSYDFCTRCFAPFHHPKQCKPLCKAISNADVAGTRKSKRNLKRL